MILETDDEQNVNATQGSAEHEERKLIPKPRPINKIKFEPPPTDIDRDDREIEKRAFNEPYIVKTIKNGLKIEENKELKDRA